MRRVTSETRSGLSLFEVMFLLALLAIATAVILMRVSKGRSASRRIECESNLRSLSIALDSYQLRYGQYPIGTQNPTSPILSEAKGYHHNWIEGLLPQMEQQTLAEMIDDRFGVYAAENKPVRDASLESLQCPSAGQSKHGQPNGTNYAGVTSSAEQPISESGDGAFVLNRAIRPSDLIDGLNYVALVGEKLPLGPAIGSESEAPLPWNSGTRASLRTLGHPINLTAATFLQTGSPQVKPQLKQQHIATQRMESQSNSLAASPSKSFVGGIASLHPGGAYLLLASGQLRFCSEQTDRRILEQLGGRSNDVSASELGDLKSSP